MTGAEYIVKLLERSGVTHAFMVNGGGAMYLNDAFSRSENIKVTYCHHEQACAMAAVGYSKYENKIAVVVTSTGCGSTNTMTGLLDAWQDGSKVLFISGNVSLSDCDQVGIGKKRKYGVQGANIIELVNPITVYSKVIRKTSDIMEYLHSAFENINYHIGPAWLDVPMDVQNGEVVELKNIVDECVDKFFAAKKPIIVAGYGIRQSNCVDLFKAFIEKYEIPYVSTYLGIDYFPSDHLLNIGRLGTKGDRAGNYAVRQADLVIVLGSSLTVPVVGYGDDFSRLNIININIDNGIYIKKFILLVDYRKSEYKVDKQWQYQCNIWKQQWPVFQNEYKSVIDGINIYNLLEKIHIYSDDDAVLVSDAGSVYYATSQAYRIKGTQRYITSGGQADMGFSLPAAIGVGLATGKQVIALTGDGSVQMNIQELGTLAKLKHLNIKLIVVNNGGYLSIRNTASKFFGGHIKGTDENNGLKFPDLGKVCDAYGLNYTKIEGGGLWKLAHIFQRRSAPEIIEIICKKDQEILPCAAKGYGLDKMYPFV